MNFRSTLTASFLAFSLLSFAEEPNPFLNQEPRKAVPETSGDSFVNLTEHLLVPADQLDAWLEKHPLKEDASELRAQVQIWIKEGSAQLDQTAFSTGTAGREFLNASMWEQTYATEYDPPGPGEWPTPSSFETRNLGYNVSGDAAIESGAMLLQAKMGFSGMMLPHHAWNELAERTRQPDDVFIPRFRSIRAERAYKDEKGNEPQTDPFASEPAKLPVGANDIRFIPGKTYLASRADDDLPEPNQSTSPELPVKPKPRDPHHLVRLIFFCGNVLPAPAAPPAATTDIHHISSKLIRVDHRTFSDWVQANDLAKIPDLAWATTSEWLKNGKAETTSDLTAPNQAGSACMIEDVAEVIYPTQWEPGQRSLAADGKPSQLEHGNATAFETRNVGTTLQAEVLSDPKGAIVHFELKRVVEGGKSVHHRILRHGEWKADMTFPIFSSNSWQSELRVKRGEWLLIGSGSDIDAKGKLHPTRSVLAFIKLD